MTWLASIGVALLTGIAGLCAAGVVSAFAVEWYRISSFEGGAGFFVVGNAILGGLIATVIGLITARVVARRPGAGFWRGLGTSVGLVVAIAAAVAGAARLLADVPPEIEGDTLLLQVELRWPAAAPRPVLPPGGGSVQFGALGLFSNVQRASTQGPLWSADARQEDGRWIVPGAVEIFTSRGQRLLDFLSGDTHLAGFLIPLPGSPSAADQSWSGWFPAPPNQPLPDDQYSVRYRVVRRSDALRRDTIGPFEITTSVTDFFRVSGSDRFGATSRFTVRLGGEAMPDLGAADAVAIVSQAPAAVLVHLIDAPEHSCRLVVADGDGLRIEPVTSCTGVNEARLLTNDRAQFTAARVRPHVPGWIDWDTFAVPGLYVLNDAVIDTRTLAVMPAAEDTAADLVVVPSVPPLALSPDGRRFVRFGYGERTSDQPVLIVTRIGDPARDALPIDVKRMRYATLEALDPAWVAHHFTWQPSPDGDRLVERPGFVPIPYRGEVSEDGDGDVSYRLEPAREPLRTALVAFLERELGAEPLPGNEPGEYEHALRIDGTVVNVAASDEFDYVLVSVAQPAGGAVVRSIAARFDAALATGEYDALFGGRID